MTLWIRKERAGNVSAGLSWPTDGAVIPVDDDDLARELLWIPGFSEVAPPPTEPVAVTEPDPDAHTGTAGPDAENAPPAPDPAAKPPRAGQKRRITE